MQSTFSIYRYSLLLTMYNLTQKFSRKSVAIKNCSFGKSDFRSKPWINFGISWVITSSGFLKLLWCVSWSSLIVRPIGLERASTRHKSVWKYFIWKSSKVDSRLRSKVTFSEWEIFYGHTSMREFLEPWVRQIWARTNTIDHRIWAKFTPSNSTSMFARFLACISSSWFWQSRWDF